MLKLAPHPDAATKPYIAIQNFAEVRGVQFIEHTS